ncbi:MAG: sugar O-acetyltransferase [Eubacteriales bacterium]|nr:sugar O-acetyltransferase [Eubacteriales bacterium]
MTELEKRDAGMWYDANYDPELVRLREEADDLCFLLNQTRPGDKERREEIMKKLLPHRGKDTIILTPLYTDYGDRCFVGDRTYINRGAYLMDCAPIRIGERCFIGPNCGMYTAIHPLIAKERNTGLEKTGPITIGDDVWIGGDVTILPGVTIGSNTVIGAGSVVSRDIPDHVVAVGNPCRVLRRITEEDSVKKDQQ